MSKLDEMKNLRGGAIYAAARVAPTTVHSWGIILGTSAGTGHPRYDAVDAVALVIMRQLTSDMSIAAAAASIIVNALRSRLSEIVERVVAEQEATGRWRWDGGPFAIVSSRPVSVHDMPEETWMTIIDGDDAGPALADAGSGMTPLVIPLRRLINKALLSLQLVLNGDIPTDLRQA